MTGVRYLDMYLDAFPASARLHCPAVMGAMQWNININHRVISSLWMCRYYDFNMSTAAYNSQLMTAAWNVGSSTSNILSIHYLGPGLYGDGVYLVMVALGSSGWQPAQIIRQRWGMSNCVQLGPARPWQCGDQKGTSSNITTLSPFVLVSTRCGDTAAKFAKYSDKLFMRHIPYFGIMQVKTDR